MKNIIIDSHCDTALKLLKGSNINDKNNQFTLNNALLYDKYIQFFAMYIEPEYIENGEYDLALRLIESIKNEVDKNIEYIQVITNRHELEKYINSKNKSLGIIISIEDASCLEGRTENLYKLYNEGVRIIGLTWNGKNEVASGVNYSNTNEDGLTLFGQEIVKKMNELGIIIDVSHLSEKSFFDVLNITSKPVIASHSCAKYLCNHKRNLTDEQIKLISKSGGIIGINFYKDFINVDRNKANIEYVVKHIKHICEIGGNDCVAIGSDYDGISKNNTAIGLEDNSKLVDLIQYLKKENFTDEVIEKIMWKNQYDFLKRQLK